MEQGAFSIFIDEVNMHYKLRLRDDPRIDSVIFFEDKMTIVAHVKQGICISDPDDDINESKS